MLSFRVFVICLFLVASCSLSLREHLLGFSIQLELQTHNLLRVKHEIGNLILDNALNSQAQAYANKVAYTKIYAPSGSKEVGENLYYTSGSYNSPAATRTWGREKLLYDYKNPGFSQETKHFTQIVWKSTLKVGFGFAAGYVVANYLPRGNQIKQFQKNVLRPPR